MNHAHDLLQRTRIQDLAVIIAGVITLEVLQETGIVDSIWTDAAGRPHTALGLLHDGREDEAVVHLGLLRDRLDGRVQVGGLLRRVVGLVVEDVAGAGDYVRVGDPHVVEADPLQLGWPARGR